MAVEVLMPRLGWTMETGSVLAWHKHEGEAVEVGEILLTVQSDKAATEVEALESGVLHMAVGAPPIGAEVPIGTLLAYLLSPGEAPPGETPARAPAATLPVAPEDGSAPPPAATSPAPAAVAGASGVASRADRQAHDGQVNIAATVAAQAQAAASPRARRVATELGIDWTALRGSGRTGRIVERDVLAAALTAAAPPRVRVTPLARRRAAAGIDVESLAVASAGGRVSQADVAAGVRRLVAQRLTESTRTTVPVTLTTEADATELARLRAEIKADAGHSTGERHEGDARDERSRGTGGDGGYHGGMVPSYTDLLAKVVAVALAAHPDLNASWSDEGVVRHSEVHVGIAVDTGRGLFVPVVRDVARKPVAAIARESAQLIARARAGQCTADELRGGTFTITNLGRYDIDAFTPVINLPECAVLGVGRVVARPVVVVDEAAERVDVRKMVALSLTFDHRIVDGAPAARFLQRVKHLVEHPYLWLTR
ncbi:MAG: 2-oxo acid dehydrogenase subunit E2 [Chloroflexi bacterium]|nr:2-oxo acid dehydrogenase subunit E2 [Chloroflexota bacterium]